MVPEKRAAIPGSSPAAHRPGRSALTWRGYPHGRARGMIRAVTHCALLLALAASPLAAQQLAADLNESVTKIPAAGVEMVVTTFKPDGDGPFPLVIISHGRAAAAVDRAKVPRQRYTDAARYFVQRGFAVVVPTRKGYGETGGSDPEHSGACVNPAYAPTFDAALESIVPALEWAK